MLGEIGEIWGTMADLAGSLGFEEVVFLAGIGAGEIVSVLQATSKHSSRARRGKVDWFFIEFKLK